MTRWVCFGRDDRASFLETWHLVYTVHGKARLVCGHNKLLDRAWCWETALPAQLCMNCLLKLAWRWGRAEWSTYRRIRNK